MKGLSMSNDTEWITGRINEAKKLNMSVFPAAPTRLEELLKGQLSERQLTHKELNNVADELIGGMVTASKKLEEKQ